MSRAVQCLVTKKHVRLGTLLQSQGQRESVETKEPRNVVYRIAVLRGQLV